MRAAGAAQQRTGSVCRASALVVASACLAWLAGCALAGNPLPPTLWLPAPVKDLTATRVGNEVHLHWTMPRRTTDKVALKGDQRARFCWEWPFAQGPTPPGCTAIGHATFPPAKEADIALPLPSELTSGRKNLVAFYVELENRAGKTAGPSNPAWVATGAAPPAVTGFGAEAGAEGVLLHWNKVGPQPDLVLRIHRDLVTGAGAAKPNEDQGAPLPEQQTLEVDLDQTDPGEALDRGVVLDHTWRYTAERVRRVQADPHPLEIGGNRSAAVTVDAKDVFPPTVPQGLAAVADVQHHAIDLSWMPDAETDLAGYFVYRRDLTASGTVERVSGSKPIVTPSYSDTAVGSGHRYAYAVSAVDRDGNESTPSAEVEEGLPE